MIDVIRAASTCDQAAGMYLACEPRWFNNAELTQAAVDVCEDTFSQKMSEAQFEAYQDRSSEGCVVKYQSPDMRILWSAVRTCQVRLARDTARIWAKRKPRR